MLRTVLVIFFCLLLVSCQEGFNDNPNLNKGTENIENENVKNVNSTTTKEVEPTDPKVPQRIFILKRLPDGKIQKIETKSQDVVVKINQIVNDDFPKIKIYLSVTNRNGEPVEIENTDVIFVDENEKLVPRNDIVSIKQHKNVKVKTPLNMVLAIDKSGSMAYVNKQLMNDPAQQPISFAKEAAINFIKKMQEGDTVQVLAFDGDIHFLDENQYAIKLIEQLQAKGNTALYAALYYAVNKLKGLGGIKGVILLTDGKNDLNSGSYNAALKKFNLERGLSLAREFGIPVFSIGFGKGADIETLKKIADETHSIFFTTEDKEEISKLYEGIRHIINNQYVITYRTKSFDNKTNVRVHVFSQSDYRSYVNTDDLLLKAAELRERIRNIEKKEQELIKMKKEMKQTIKEYNVKLEKLDEKEKDFKNKILVLESEKKDLEKKKAEFDKKAELQRLELSKIGDELDKVSKELELRKRNITLDFEKLENERKLFLNQKDDIIEKEKKISLLSEKLSKRNQTLNSNQKKLAVKEVTLERERVKLLNQSNKLEQIQSDIEMEKKRLEAEKTGLLSVKKSIDSQKSEIALKQQKLNKEKQILLAKKNEFEKVYQNFLTDKENVIKLKQEIEKDKKRTILLKKDLGKFVKETEEKLTNIDKKELLK